MSKLITSQPIKLAIAAMGGQGGGVLSSWIVALAENNQYLAQYTSVPGVAQRTGATIYYIELFPEQLAIDAGQDPVMALMPVSGDVDIVIAGELVEAGRAISRGLVTPSQTSLILSSHRLYSQLEKQALGDGRIEPDLILQAAGEHANSLISFDMNATANEKKCMISAILYGALAASEALPFTAEQFKTVIIENGKAVESNLAGFEAAYKIAKNLPDKTQEDTSAIQKESTSSIPTSSNNKLQVLLAAVQAKLPAQCHAFAIEGIKRLIDYQDIQYADMYINQLMAIYEQDKTLGENDYLLTREMARHLALWMSYEDTIRVADLKIRKQRFARYKQQGGGNEQDLSHVVEFMHPRVEEIADTMPAWVGGLIMNKGAINRFVNYFCKPRQVKTSRLSGFLMLWTVAKFKKIRRSTLRFKRETQRIEEWKTLVKQVSNQEYAAGVAIAKCQRLIKGYGDTHENGWSNYQAITASLSAVMQREKPGKMLTQLCDAALADESGEQLQKSLDEIVLIA